MSLGAGVRSAVMVAVRRLRRRALACGLPVALAIALGGAAANSAVAADSAAEKVATLRSLIETSQGRALLDLLGDPEVRASLLRQAAARAAPPTAPRSIGEHLDRALDRLRARLIGLGAQARTLPLETRRLGASLERALPGPEMLLMGGAFLAFLLSGIGTELLFFRATRKLRESVTHAPLDTVARRTTVILKRSLYGLTMLATFTAGSLGAFLLFKWPPMVGAIMLCYLTSLVLLRLSFVVTRFLLAPGAERFRLIPIGTGAAYFWHRWLAVAVGIAVFGWQTLAVLQILSVSPAVQDLFTQMLGLVLVCIGVAIVWIGEISGHADWRQWRLMALPVVASIYLPCIWVAFLMGAAPLGWLLVALGALPVALFTVHSAVRTAVRGRAEETVEAEHPYSVVVERALQALVVVAAALALAQAWHIDFGRLASSEMAGARLARGLLEALVILLLADVFWKIARGLIDRRMGLATAVAREVDDAERRRHARLHTLLPVFRSMLFLTVFLMAVISALSALGLQIGPLLAGAGVVGIAVGLGAQTLVRDVIAGVFFLLDDAFRVGEYIESGSIAGTVESFSLRSIKLRHYMGQLHTVPFGELKSITNYSRDWANDQVRIGVPYDTDLDEVEQVIETVSRELMHDPLTAELIIEPLKSLGVSGMGDYAIQIELSVRTRPGEQFAVRSVVLSRIKKAFARHGIRFAFPTVQVASPEAAAAVTVLDAVRPA